MHQLFQDGGKWSDTDSTTDQNGHIKSVPILMSLSKWSIQQQLWIRLSTQNGWVEALTEVLGPWANSTDVQTQVFLMWSRCQCEGMVFTRVLGQASNTHPLAGLVLKGDWSLEVDANNLRWQEVSPDNDNLHFVAANADELVYSKDTCRTKEEVAKQWVLHQTSGAMKEHENVEDVVPVMCEPEGLEDVSTGILYCKHVHYNGDQCQHEPSKT